MFVGITNTRTSRVQQTREQTQRALVCVCQATTAEHAAAKSKLVLHLTRKITFIGACRTRSLYHTKTTRESVSRERALAATHNFDFVSLVPLRVSLRTITHCGMVLWDRSYHLLDINITIPKRARAEQTSEVRLLRGLHAPLYSTQCHRDPQSPSQDISSFSLFHSLTSHVRHGRTCALVFHLCSPHPPSSFHPLQSRINAINPLS
jgi:hypothetical protein